MSNYTAGIQDPRPAMPETIQFTRYYPRRGPSGAVIFLGVFAVMGAGWYFVAENNHERRELRREKTWNRISLVPLLQAETDRDLVRRLAANAAKEAELMAKSDKDKDWSAVDLKTPVKGIKRFGEYDETRQEATPVYYTDRYVAPTYLFVAPDSADRLASQWWRGSQLFTINPPYHNR
ncbi:GRIM-19 protein-domain-containing protein [Obelidium mucronatum]|nr:GRIM-19 protein-domain-containing protein [Obelidium mucronatum]